ncbi:MAG TPA: dihydrofolate reductase family protein, partial [Turneriella sp.]|nr:dihydrofolate reductase family protein [Turneriella sp.]
MPQKISAPPKTKTTIRLNMAMTIDGHVAHPTQAWEFGSAEDRRRMDRLREWADCLIVARRTIEHD